MTWPSSLNFLMVCCQPAHKPRPGFHRRTGAAFGYGARGELLCTKKSERFGRALLRDHATDVHAGTGDRGVRFAARCCGHVNLVARRYKPRKEMRASLTARRYSHSRTVPRVLYFQQGRNYECHTLTLARRMAHELSGNSIPGEFK